MKPCSKTKSNKNTFANIFLELPLTILFRHDLEMKATSCYWSYVNFYTLITFNYILSETYNSDTAARAAPISSPQKYSYHFYKFQRKAPVLESLFYKVASLQACNVTKKRLLHRCFPMKFEKFWRTTISKNIWTTASVYWLLHHILIFTILYSTRFTFLQITSSLLRN